MRERKGMARLSLVAAMMIFGTTGVFRKTDTAPLQRDIRSQGRPWRRVPAGPREAEGRLGLQEGAERPPVPGGALLGFNWILLFESYQKTSVAGAVLALGFALVSELGE